jgi:integrase
MAHIRNNSSGTFRADIRRKGITINKTFPSRIKAQQWADEIEDKIKRIRGSSKEEIKSLTIDQVEALGGVSLFKRLHIKLDIMLFNDLVDEHVSQWRGKDSSLLWRLKFWTDTLGNQPIKAIKSAEIKQALRDYGKGLNPDGSISKPRGKNAQKRLKATLSGVFLYACNPENEYLEINPAQFKWVSEDIKIVRYLSNAERERLLSETKKPEYWDKLYLLVLMAMCTGMRKSEMLNLKWNDVDFEQATASLADSKNGEPRINPLPSIVLTELRKFRTIGNGFVYCHDNPHQPFDFRRNWERVRRNADIQRFRFHDLRHTAASYLIMGGANLYETGQILGHKSPETTARYAHVSVEHKKNVSNQVFTKLLSETI